MTSWYEILRKLRAILRPIEGTPSTVKYAIRSLSRQRGFTIVAIAILAMGIGSTLAVFSLIDALILRPLPIRNADELVRISTILREGGFGTLPTTFLEALKRVPDYQGVCGFDTAYPGVEINGSITSVGTLGFSGDCFSTLGIEVQLGRALKPTDDHAGSEAVAVITDAFWQRQFNASRDALGQRIRMEGQTYTVVGVAEPRFTGLLVGFPAGMIIPATQEYSELMPNGRKPTYWWVNVLARRARGISEPVAETRMKVRAYQLLEASVPPHFSAERRKIYLANKIAATSGRAGIDYFLRRRFGSSLFAAGGICVAILLIGCTNLSNLLLARTLRRRHEMAVRFALGANWGEIAYLFAMESFLLVVAGAGLGLLIARAVDQWVLATGARMFGNFDLGLRFDWRIALLVTAAIAVISIALAAVSAWRAGKMRDSGALKERGRGIAEGVGGAQKALIALQIALTLALVAGSGLLTASVEHLYAIDLGVDARNVWDVMLSTRPGAKTYFDRGPYDREILNEIHQMPGVESVTLADSVPFYVSPGPETIAELDTGGPQRELDGTVLATSAEFFKTLGIKVIAGESYEERQDGEPAAVISKSLAAKWSDQPNKIIGHHLRLGSDARYQHIRVSGVVSDAQMNLAHPEQLAPFTVYLNIWQHPDRQGYPVLLIKTSANALDVSALRKIVDARGHEYVDRVRTLSDEKDGALMENQLLAYLSEAFSGLALMMASMGLFGLLSYQVANRTSEIGVRLAVGAQRSQIQWMVVRQMIGMVVTGIVLGLFCSLGVARLIQGLLFGVSPYDPKLLAFSCIVLMATALLAAWLPARRASSVDPLTALRHE